MNNFTIKTFNIGFYQELLNLIKQKSLPYSKKCYVSQQVIFHPHTPCDSIGIVLSGQVNIEHILEDGKKLIVSQLKAYDIFGEILVFSEQQTYPYTIATVVDCEIVFIHRTILLAVLKESPLLLEQFLRHISSSYMTINKYIKMISQKQIIHKLAYYLIYYGEITALNRITTIHTQQMLADFIGVERQSLIRALNQLKKQGVLDYQRNKITVNNLPYLQNLVQ